ncbi:putative aminomethyltransferase [Candidatus Bilamarchaeum dharawalense]|uniref:Probable aminomethyltransferase n=1 Tax=Candidatus Bilamarchaeum dharawalense TaxID=2885759 RepID=A0A5E4LNX8_9ARCH|nr:putative aminomethyltransferase [Candidatus Bilamarchaeum dharawalense]
MVQRTPLYNEHVKLGGHVIDFAGWELPVYYTNIIDEHNTVRQSVGLFDICHMGEFFVEGKDAFTLLQKCLTRNLDGMKMNTIKYSTMLNEGGTIIDDLLFYKFNEQKYFVVVNAANIEKDFNWLKKNAAGLDVQLSNISAQTMKLDLQGPKAQATVAKISDIDFNSIKFYRFVEGKVAGCDCIVSRTGYTGEDGFEIYSNENNAPKIWNALLEAGKEFGIKPCGLGARDTLRLECAMMLYGNDIDDQHTPLEAELDKMVALEKTFIGKEPLEKQKAEGVKRKLIAFEMTDSAIARHGYEFYSGNRKIGIITSGSYCPTLKKPLGLGYIETEFSTIGSEIEVMIRGALHKAKVVEKPFYKRQR